MTGVTIGELLDKVFYGDEIEFQINDIFYSRNFFQQQVPTDG